MASSNREISFLLHGLGLLSFAISFEYIFSRSNKINRGYGGHFQFLTNIGLLLSTLVSSSGMLNDIIHSVNLDRTRRIIRFIAMPLEVTITLSYWLVYFSNVSLLVDQRAGSLMPLWKDIGLHLLPALFMLGEYYILPPKQALHMRSDLAFIAFAGSLSIYSLWLVICYQKNGFWPYPLLAKVGQEVKAALLIVTTGMMWVARVLVLGWSMRRKEATRC